MALTEKFQSFLRDTNKHALKSVYEKNRDELKTSKQAPYFQFDPNNWIINGADRTPLSVRRLDQLNDKPVIVLFYSRLWKEEGIRFLDHFKKLNPTDEFDLLIITPDNSIDLTAFYGKFGKGPYVYRDRQNLLAEKFGVWSEDEPTWSRYSGLNDNVALLSAFVVDTAGRIAFNYIESFNEELEHSDLNYALSA